MSDWPPHSWTYAMDAANHMACLYGERWRVWMERRPGGGWRACIGRSRPRWPSERQS